MRLVCKKCGAQFDSLLIDQRQAFNELVTKSTNHVKFRHKQVFEALAVAIQKCSMSLAQFLHFDECVIVPENEEWVQEQLEETQKMLAEAILGFDPFEEDEEEEEEETEDTDDEPQVGEIETIDLVSETPSPEGGNE
jgi:hypothetical protein